MFLEKSESIYDNFKSEHIWVKQQFQQIISKRDMAIFSQTLGPLTKHMSGEEAVFYLKAELWVARTRNKGEDHEVL